MWALDLGFAKVALDPALGLAVLGLLLALAAWLRLIAVGRNYNKLVRRVTELEAWIQQEQQKELTKAILRARLRTDSNSQGLARLELRNYGYAPARQISIELDGMVWSQHPAILEATKVVPPELPSQASATWLVNLATTAGAPKRAVLRWSDGSGQLGYQEEILHT